ncbi:hypothetical protein HA466_0247680 [Hirschfeldia incana]|nr:hypothetical protein HA466_0247660 [Hirschfeldia incana]KAJ0237355.1 hypothetical protein HA466_0247680 [Hirschfeldia incana]
MSEVDDLIQKLEEAEKMVIKDGNTSQANEQRGKVFKRFSEEFQQNREGTLTHVLRKLTGLLPSEVYPRFSYATKKPSSVVDKKEEKYWSTEDKIKSHINRFMRNRIGDLIGEALETTIPQQLRALATYVEDLALSNATTFDVSDTSHVDPLISVMQMMVQFYKRGAHINRVLDFVNIRVLPQFKKLPEDRILDFIRALAEISLFARVPVASDTLRSMAGILKMYMPTSMPSVFEEEKSSTHVECLLYVFHHLAHKANNAKTATELCEQLRERLKNVTLMTSTRIRELRINLIDDEKDVRDFTRGVMELKFLAEMKKEKTVNELRSCINIIGMTEVLLARKISFTGDESVNLSWKEARKHSLVSEITNTIYPKVPDRRDKINSLPKERLDCLKEDFICNLNRSEVLSLGALKESQLSKGDGEFRLHKQSEIGMLFWKMSEKELGKVARPVSKCDRYTCAIRDQKYHLLCGAYVATDLVSSLRCIRKLDDKYIPLCTWYLCAHTDSKALGKDPRGLKIDHHCYGSSIENFLLHIQTHGVPREIFDEFDCKNHHPPTADDPWRSLRKIKAVRRIPTLEEAVRELRKGWPIGADLLHYSGLFELSDGIYYGPHQKNSFFLAYHAVIVDSITIMNGELVAVCRLSNGVDTGDDGYVYVSLATLFYPMSAFGESQKNVRAMSEPSHLLTNFVTLELEGGEKREKRQDPSPPPKRHWDSDSKRRQDPYPHKRSRFSDSDSRRRSERS